MYDYESLSVRKIGFFLLKNSLAYEMRVLLARPHNGVDYAAKMGEPVKAVESGLIEQAGYINGYGFTIILEHENGLKTLYAHLGEIKVTVGDKVKAGAIIGLAGQTGITDRPQLHFEVLSQEQPENPHQYLK